VLLLPFHHPVGLAKRLATIDVLSSGRMRLLTIGSAASRARPPPSESITRPGAAAPTRRSTSCALSGRDAAGTSFDGEFYSFENVTGYPKPLQMLPIHVGGSSAALPGEGTGSSPAAG
jgi:alkanesulfonate monooxygenase SsuD/methylene tetrahydromethanopterin reductase-like flavin-dependent oxidoreductase (luciferase family)